MCHCRCTFGTRHFFYKYENMMNITASVHTITSEGVCDTFLPFALGMRMVNVENLFFVNRNAYSETE